jgi:hypothetical protein
MANNKDRTVDFLTESSPVLSDAAALLSQTYLRPVGLEASDPDREPIAGKLSAESVKSAELVAQQAPIVSIAAPDLALAAPDTAIAA